MTKNKKQTFFIIIAFFLSILLIWYSFKDIDFQNFLNALKNANYIWVIISVLLGIFSYYLRAKRWLLLLAPMGYIVELKNTFWSISFAYFMNLIIPRSGEVARATSLYSTEDVPVDKGFGTIVSERFVDLICLIILVIASVILNLDLFKQFFILGDTNPQEKIDSLIKLFWYGIIGFIVICIGLYLFRKNLLKIKFVQKIIDFLKGMLEGIMTIFKMKNSFQFILLSILVWLSYYLMTYLVVFAFPESSNFSWQEGLFLLVAGSFGMLLPATGAVAYPISMQLAFGAIYFIRGFSVKEGELIGANYGWVLWGAQTLMVIIMGFIAIIEIAKAKKKIQNG